MKLPVGYRERQELVIVTETSITAFLDTAATKKHQKVCIYDFKVDITKLKINSFQQKATSAILISTA